MTKFIDNQWLETEICCKCGMLYAMTTDFQRRRRDDREWFYCPAGHQQHYTGKTEAQKLKQELERKEEMLVAADARASKSERILTRVSRAHNKMRTRVMNGVCPCCNRSFGNLREHMKTQHPEFGKADTMSGLRHAFGMSQGDVAREVDVPGPYVSSYERGKHVPVAAKTRLDMWIDEQTAKAPE
jgi:DNA-binding transcriptional regulator YiaG